MRLDAPFQGFLQLRQFPAASVPRANSVRACAWLSPWMIALIMPCPLLPHTCDTTLLSLILAVSKTLCNRLICSRVLRDQAFAVAHQIPQHPYWLSRNETGADQAMPQQIGNPFTIPHIGFPTREGFDLMGIGQNQLKLVFQHIVDWPPEHSR